MILNEDKKKQPPSVSSSSVSDMLALECFKAVKEGRPQQFAKYLKELINIELMKKE